MTKMRAKMRISNISCNGNIEELTMNAVSKSTGYPEDGSDEDNTYAKWTPTATLNISITNPNLHKQFKVGQKFYVDFIEAE